MGNERRALALFVSFGVALLASGCSPVEPTSAEILAALQMNSRDRFHIDEFVSVKKIECKYVKSEIYPYHICGFAVHAETDGKDIKGNAVINVAWRGGQWIATELTLSKKLVVTPLLTTASQQNVVASIVDSKVDDKRIDSCVDQWVNSYRKENGSDSVVTDDQLTEWKGECLHGKLPSS